MPRVMVFGHGSDAPGDALNSRASFERVAGLGIDGIELDVRHTADDVLVAHHDARVASGVLLSQLRFADLVPAPPTLHEVLDLCGHMVVNVEIKSYPSDESYDPAEHLTDLVVAAIDLDRHRVIVSSFGMPCLDRVRAVAPDIPTAFLTYHPFEVVPVLDDLVARGHRIVHPYDPHVDERFMAAARERELTVNAWTMRDDDATLSRLVDLGVDGIITGAPQRVVALLDARP